MKRFLFLLPWLFLFLSSRTEEALLFLLAVLIHEGGHLFAIALMDVPLKSFSLSPLGAEITMADPYLSYRKEILIALAGPGAGLFCTAGLVSLIRQSFAPLPIYFFFCNLFLALFNLLPISGLDGGKILSSLLYQLWREDVARNIFSAVHTVTLSLLFLFGLIFLIENRNPSIFSIALFLFVGEKKKKATKIS